MKSVRFCTRRLIVSRTKDRSRVVKRVLSVGRNKECKNYWGCVFQDVEPRKIKTILRKDTQLTQTPCANCENRVAICLHSGIKRSNDGELFNCPVVMSAARMLPHLKILVKKRREDKSDAPAGIYGNWPTAFTSSTRNTKHHSSRLRMFGVSPRHPQLNKRKESLLWVPEHQAGKI